MEERQIWIEQMVMDISTHALRLDEVRLQSFMGWLEAHSCSVKTARQGSMDEQLKEALKGWLESLPIPGLLWEYHLILNEIAWRREPARMMMLQGLEQHV